MNMEEIIANDQALAERFLRRVRLYRLERMKLTERSKVIAACESEIVSLQHQLLHGSPTLHSLRGTKTQLEIMISKEQEHIQAGRGLGDRAARWFRGQG